MRHVSAHGFIRLLQRHPRAKVLDVRFGYEREVGHVTGDCHVPWYTPEWEPDPAFLAQVLRVCDPGDTVLVLCRTGHRSSEAAALLETAGFKKVYNVLGGYADILETRRAKSRICRSERPFVMDTAGDARGRTRREPCSPRLRD
jgi:rhodanese-related sulfurtransferase